MERAVKVGIVGLGPRAEVLLAAFLRMDEVDVMAVCDLQEAPIQKTLGIFERYGKPTPQTFKDYHKMLELEELEAVFIPTSWNSHLAIAADCLEAGKYAAIEVGGASSVEELWQLVHAYERTKTPVMMLENCCYCKQELTVMNMVRQGLFGELVYCEGGYEHNLRNTLAQMENSGEERAYHNRFRNGELYPTHELGPIAKILRINRGNRFLSLTSTATKSVSIPQWRREQGGYPDVPFHQGDMITTVIKCAGGEVITLHHSVSLPRPYSRNGRVQGTKGIWLEDVKGLYIEGMVWHEMHDFTPDCVLMVLASEHYDEADYIRDYEEYKKAYTMEN
jgi:predicted dehydrogenase